MSNPQVISTDSAANLSNSGGSEVRTPSPIGRIASTFPIQKSTTLPTGISNKLRNFLQLAKKHSYDWAWIDTACIDKTNSAELTEAINSMFRYYMLSDVCYAYFSDVPPLDNADDGHAKKTCRVVRYARLNLRGLS